MPTNLTRQLMVNCTNGLYEAVNDYASQQTRATGVKLSVAEVVRVALTQYLNYTETEAPATHGNRKYASTRERELAYLEREKANRRLKREAKDALAQGDRRAAVIALARSLGIDPDTLMSTDTDTE